MPLNVAQLNILVGADSSAAMAVLNQVNQAYATAAQAAAQAAQGEAASQQQVVEAISAVVMAQRQQTAVILESAEQTNSALNSMTQGAGRTTSAVSAIGTNGVSNVMALNQAFMLTGQSFGPINQGLLLATNQIARIPQEASNARIAITAMGAAAVLAGALIINFASKQQDALAQLDASLNDTGKNVEDYQSAISAAEAEGEKWGKTTADTDHALSTLARAVKDPQQLLLAYGDAANVADARGQSLAAAADTVTRAMEGQSRALRVLGINMTLVSDPAKKLQDAMTVLGEKLNTLHNANASLADAQQRYNDQLTEASLRADGVTKAVEQLTNAQQAYQDLVDKFAAADAIPQETHTQRATQTLADAAQHLQDVQDLQAAAALAPQIDKVAEATGRLNEAQARLVELQAAAQKAQADPTGLEKMAAASQKVLDAQLRLAAAQGGDIATAQNQLRAAVDAQRQALDAQYEKQKQYTDNSSTMISANNAVRSATDALAQAQAEQAQKAAGQSEAQIRAAIDLRNAQEAVTRAVDDLAIAKAQDTGEADQKALDRAIQLRDAKQRIHDAEDGVTQAMKNQQIQALQLADAHLAIDRAERQVAIDRQKAIDELVKVLVLQDVVKNQTQKVLDAINGQVKGTSDSMAETIGGMFRSWWASFQDFMGGLGPAVGQILIIGGIVVGAMGGIGAAFEFIGAAVAGIGSAIGIAVGFIGTVLIPLALVAAALYVVYQNLNQVFDVRDAWGATWNWIQNVAGDSINAIIKSFWNLYDVGYGIFDWFHHLPERMGDAWGAMRAWGWNFAMGLYNGVVTVWDGYVWPFVSKMFGWLVNPFSNIYDWMHTVGWNMIVGLWNGIMAVWDNFTSWVADAFHNSFVGTLLSYFGINSPSRLFHEIGLGLMEGLGNGIAAGQGGATDAMMTAARRLSAVGFKTTALGSGAVGVGGDLASHLASGGVVVVNNQQQVHVEGSVVTEKELTHKVRDGLIEIGYGQGGSTLGGYG